MVVAVCERVKGRRGVGWKGMTVVVAVSELGCGVDGGGGG